VCTDSPLCGHTGPQERVGWRRTLPDTKRGETGKARVGGTTLQTQSAIPTRKHTPDPSA